MALGMLAKKIYYSEVMMSKYENGTVTWAWLASFVNIWRPLKYKNVLSRSDDWDNK